MRLLIKLEQELLIIKKIKKTSFRKKNMKIGVPKEIKPQENRIGLTPDSVKILTSNGHEVLVENNGGFEAGFYNDQYLKKIV